MKACDHRGDATTTKNSIALIWLDDDAKKTLEQK
jgi:hypothetical protein